MKFCRGPPETTIPTFTSVCDPEQALVQQEDLAMLLAKGAIREVDTCNHQMGFFPATSWYPSATESPSPSGPQGPQLLSSAPKMQDADGPQGTSGHQYGGLVCHYRSEGCLLQDPYLAGALAVPQIRVRVGISLAPRTFIRCIDAALALMRLQGLRVLNYLDNWLVALYHIHM